MIHFRRTAFVGVLAACFLLTLGRTRGVAAARPLLTDSPGADDFVLAAANRLATICLEPETDHAVARAAGDLATDVERVTGARPQMSRETAARRGTIVIIGVIGRSPLVDGLVAAGKLEATGMRGEWESFVVQVVSQPLPGVDQALVVAGSDRRGTIFGIYTLSEAIGVSPWYWWADVPVKRRAMIAIRAGAHREGPPSVKYRGVFLNDEDWGLQPWAAKTFDPDLGDIGPKTYARIFELLLRLKANTLWPAMHACTKAFNLDPQNRELADAYGVVMGSSHAEPMLRNNVTEWTAPPERYNYLTNREGVRAYWEQRVRENGRFENIYTLGMRGIHDSPIQGPVTEAERIRVLEQVFADQRAILAQQVNPDVTRVPQVFTPYKEVLEIYRAGLRVPDDVTLVWPDDNFGYIRHFPTAAERRRPGGSGVYYHLSYLGSPLSYLWLGTTPPALIWEEMSKAYDLGARTVWIANVGDLKPVEPGTEFFLQLAWDIRRWRRDNLPGYLVAWATREFGAGQATEIAGIMDGYYRLNFQRKPEHLQWWLPREAARPSLLSTEEVQQRLAAFARLRAEVDRLSAAMPAEARDAYYELVAYPVRGAALANERYFAGEQSALHAAAGDPDAADLAREAENADAGLKEATRIFNEQVAGGKWRRIIALEPADAQWRGIRIAPWRLPEFAAQGGRPANGGRPEPGKVRAPAALVPLQSPPAGFAGFAEKNGIVSLEAGHFTEKTDRGGAGWEVIPGLGRTGDAVAVFPTTAASIDPARLAIDAPRLGYQVCLAAAGNLTAALDLLPTQPVNPGTPLRLAIALDDDAPQVVIAGAEVGTREWAQGVLNEVVTATAPLRASAAGAHILRVYMVDPGVVLDKIVLARGGLPPSYLGPPETRTTP